MNTEKPKITKQKVIARCAHCETIIPHQHAKQIRMLGCPSCSSHIGIKLTIQLEVSNLHAEHIHEMDSDLAA